MGCRHPGCLRGNLHNDALVAFDYFVVSAVAFDYSVVPDPDAVVAMILAAVYHHRAFACWPLLFRWYSG